jgi:predicted DNA-binding transcriptional regulator AlpA
LFLRVTTERNNMNTNTNTEFDAYSVDEFCRRHSLSRVKLYDLWKHGAGPKRMKIGSRTLVSKEAAADWRRQCEQESAA